nr:hypothetical protein [Aquihabitans sp. G128]
MGGGHVGHAAVEEAGSRGGHLVGLLADEGEQHGEVVGGEAPERVLLLADAPEVQAVGVEVAELAQRPPLHELLELQERRVVLQQVPHHQGAPGGGGRSHDRLGVGHRERQRLLHEDVLAGLERLDGQPGVVHRGRGDDQGVDLGVGHHLGEGAGCDPVGLGLGCGDRRDGVDDGDQRAEAGVGAHQVAAPRAAAHDGHPDPVLVPRAGRVHVVPSPGRTTYSAAPGPENLAPTP